MESVIAAAPDGRAPMPTANALAADVALYKPIPFDAERDPALIAQVGRVPVVIAANTSVPCDTIAPLVAAAQAKSDAATCATPGNGATPRMAVERFAKTAGIDLQHVPYRGGSQAVTDTIGGPVTLVAVNALEAPPHVRSGKLKIIATLGASTRSAALVRPERRRCDKLVRETVTRTWVMVMSRAVVPVAPCWRRSSRTVRPAVW